MFNNQELLLFIQVGGLHKSMTRLGSSQQINGQTQNSSNNTVTTNASKWSTANVKVSSGGVTVTTISPPRMQRPLSQGPLTLMANHINQVKLY